MNYKLRHIFLLGLINLSAVSATSEYVKDFMKVVEDSDYFSPLEKDFARQLMNGADMDDSVLDAIIECPVISSKQKEMAKQYFQDRQKPKHVKFKQRRYDKDIQLVTPRMRFHGDFDFRLRSIDTARDVSTHFPLDNADKDPGIAHVIKGQLRYRPEGQKDPKSWGQIDVDVQGRDGETEIINGHFQNNQNYLKIGTYLSPNMSEFGLRNTEFSGVHFHWEQNKWMLDFLRGDTVEDYVPSLDSLSVGGFVAKRLLKSGSQDYIGLSYFDSSDSHYFGILGQAFMLDNNLRMYSEIVKQDVGTPGQDATAVEFEVDYENEKVIFLNEIQKTTAFFRSSLNPEYSNLGTSLSEYENQEHAFTYRFDPYVTSSLVLNSRKVTPLNGISEFDSIDGAWTLMTHRPDRPKYMFVVKSSSNQDATNASIDDQQFIVMGRSSWKHRDIITHVDVMRTDFTDRLLTDNSYVLNSVSVEFSRPFLNKLRVKNKLTLLDQNFENSNNDAESQQNMFQVNYQVDSRTSLQGRHNYRRVARKTFTNKYKNIWSLDARRQVDENLAYNLRLSSYNNNEFTRGYDAALVSLGADFSF